MSYKDKVEEYRVSIRRKHINEKMAHIRAKRNEFYPTEINIVDIKASIAKIITSNIKDIYLNVAEIKQYSNNEEISSYLKENFEIFYNLLIEIDTIPPEKLQNKQEQIYADLSTIIINITSSQNIDFHGQITQDIASSLIANIKKTKREINTLWIIANILFRNNRFSTYFMKALVRNKIQNYIGTRINDLFHCQTDMTIFYYFIGSLVSNLGSIQQFSQYKEYLVVIEKVSALQIEELYWYILDGLIEHSFTFFSHNYEILSTKILDKCSDFCKNKKSMFVLKYLQLLSNLLQSQSQIIHNAGQQNKKLCHQQYERLKKYGILKNLQYCLQNRSPEVKKMLFQIGFMLISLYLKDISFIDEYFYLTLAEQIKKIQKHSQKNIQAFLKYFNLLLSCLLTQININKDKKYCQMFITFIKDAELFDKISYILETFNTNLMIIDAVFNTIAYLIEYNISQIDQDINQSKIKSYLEILNIENSQIDGKRQKLLTFLQQRLSN